MDFDICNKSKHASNRTKEWTMNTSCKSTAIFVFNVISKKIALFRNRIPSCRASSFKTWRPMQHQNWEIGLNGLEYLCWQNLFTNKSHRQIMVLHTCLKQTLPIHLTCDVIHVDRFFCQDVLGLETIIHVPSLRTDGLGPGSANRSIDFSLF